jgi:hypothetical protein
MKAKVIKTGEIVNVIPEQGGWCDTDFKSYSQHYEDKELDFEFQDWSSFRRGAAKDILAGMLSNPEKISIRGERLATIEGFVNAAIEITDELIKQLKEK